MNTKSNILIAHIYSVIRDLNIDTVMKASLLLDSTVSLQVLQKKLYFHEILQGKLNSVILVG